MARGLWSSSCKNTTQPTEDVIAAGGYMCVYDRWPFPKMARYCWYPDPYVQWTHRTSPLMLTWITWPAFSTKQVLLPPLPHCEVVREGRSWCKSGLPHGGSESHLLTGAEIASIIWNVLGEFCPNSLITSFRGLSQGGL